MVVRSWFIYIRNEKIVTDKFKYESSFVLYLFLLKLVISVSKGIKLKLDYASAKISVIYRSRVSLQWFKRAREHTSPFQLGFVFSLERRGDEPTLTPRISISSATPPVSTVWSHRRQRERERGIERGGKRKTSTFDLL